MGSPGRPIPPDRRPRRLWAWHGLHGETRTFLAVAALAMVLMVVFTAASLWRHRPVDAPFVDLLDPERIDPLPSTPPPEALRVVLAAVTSPVTSRMAYEALADYLSDHLGRAVFIEQPETYAAANEMLRSGAAQVGFICTLAYVEGQEQFGLQLLAVPQIRGSTRYRSLILVPAGSPARTLSDLRGAVFAYTDPLSFSGYLAVRYLLAQEGEAAESFFGRTTFTGTHDRSVRSVAQGFLDGAAVDSLVYDSMVAQDPTLAHQVRVIASSPQAGNPPAVASPFLSPEETARLREVLLTMDRDPTGRTVLEGLGIDRFAPADDGAYDPIRSMRLVLMRGSP